MPKRYRYEEVMAGATRYSKARLEVRHHADLIIRAIDEGYSIRAIWRQLTNHELISVRYDSFRVQVNRLLEGQVGTDGDRESLALGPNHSDAEEDLDDQERLNRFMDQFR